VASLKSVYEIPAKSLDDLGGQLAFYIRALAWTPRTIRRYKKEVLRILAEVTLGSGSLAVIGGTVGVITAMCFFTGTEVGLQGYAALNQLGTAAFSGFVSAYFNTREIAPLVAGIALAATVGCGFTAQLGAMRISEEVDALEVMAIPSLPFLVTTRIIGGLIAIIPLYVVGLLSSYFATRLTVTQFFGRARAPSTTTSTSSCRPATCCGRSARCWSSR
jgi:phospholipid/cholesterol/gamma-HCH transport system permease protein